MSPDQQTTATSQAEPPGRMRLLWQALGRNRAGRLLRLAIIAIIGWAAVEIVTGISREIYRANTASDPGFAVSYAIGNKPPISLMNGSGAYGPP